MPAWVKEGGCPVRLAKLADQARVAGVRFGTNGVEVMMPCAWPRLSADISVSSNDTQASFMVFSRPNSLACFTQLTTSGPALPNSRISAPDCWACNRKVP